MIKALSVGLAWVAWAAHYLDHADDSCPKGCIYRNTSNARELRRTEKR